MKAGHPSIRPCRFVLSIRCGLRRSTAQPRRARVVPTRGTCRCLDSQRAGGPPADGSGLIMLDQAREPVTPSAPSTAGRGRQKAPAAPCRRRRCPSWWRSAGTPPSPAPPSRGFRPGAREAGARRSAGAAEVDQHRPPVADQDVLGLDVEVRQAPTVDRHERREQLGAEQRDGVVVEATLLVEQVVQGESVEVLQHDDGGAGGDRRRDQPGRSGWTRPPSAAASRRERARARGWSTWCGRASLTTPGSRSGSTRPARSRTDVRCRAAARLGARR